MAYLEKELLKKYDIDFNYKEWIYEAGIPSNALVIESKGFERIKLMAEDVSSQEISELNNKFTLADRDTYSVQEWLTFLRHLPSNISAEKMKVLDASLQFSAWTNAEIQFEWFLKSISSNYTPAYPYLSAFLEKVGRRKFILPLYEALYNNEATKEKALSWFDNYKQNYHAVSSNSIARVLHLKN